MKILVCIRQGLDGEMNPFDASAYEFALKIPGGEVTLLSMGVEKTAELLKALTRLGAKRAVLLTDKVFAGADTLATAYALSLAVKKLSPDIVVCGRQTLIGDTGQTGPMLAEIAGLRLVTGVMGCENEEEDTFLLLRSGERKKLSAGTLYTVERGFNLRLPRLGSKMCEVEKLSADDIGADRERCGLVGSPTRVIKTFENTSGRRKCRFIPRTELKTVISEALAKRDSVSDERTADKERLEKVMIIGESPRSYAESVSDNIEVFNSLSVDGIVAEIRKKEPSAVLFGSDEPSKTAAASVAARLSLGLCADCTRLQVEGGEMIMYRPALSGSLIAKIRSITAPALATVRTVTADNADIIVGAGYGVKDSLPAVRALAAELNADFAATRKLVDNGFAPYIEQVGLTGKTVSPSVYIAVGISGAVHHIAGIDRSGTVIAINPDRDAPIFDYADYGILEAF